MEDPVRFDIWVAVKPGAAAEAVAELLPLAPQLPEVEIRRRVSRSWREGTFIPLVDRVPWSQVRAIRAAPPAWAAELRCYQEGYSPDLPPAGYCPPHDLHFGGCLGCHVCTGFFAGSDRDTAGAAMTEQEWLTGESPQKMRGHLEEAGGTSERKLRLFATACCRPVGRWFLDPCQHAAVEVLERYAEGLATAGELHAACTAAGEIDEGHDLLIGTGTDADQDALDAAYHAAQVVAQATCNDPPGQDEPNYFHRLYDTIMHAVEAAGHGAVAADPVGGRSLAAQAAERRVLADLLRCVVGNPFRPAALVPSWRTSDVIALARGIYEERAFDRMPILADALQDAGCDNEDVLSHCREGGPHCRGCWVVDLVLGKE